MTHLGREALLSLLPATWANAARGLMPPLRRLAGQLGIGINVGSDLLIHELEQPFRHGASASEDADGVAAAVAQCPERTPIRPD